jgi:endonuclease/exonuclease/phosphatase family metal-dependent hydrolase
MGRSESLRTYPAWLPVLALDRIWVRPTDVVAETWVQRWEEVTHASDHLAVVARLNL